MHGYQKVLLEPAYLLHGRDYRETSRIVEVWTQGHGRVSLVARGARGRRSRWPALLQPFRPLRLSWSGRGELFTLRDAEPVRGGFDVAGDAVVPAYYLNELLMQFLRRADPHPRLFAHYGAALAELGGGAAVEPVLRRFELTLLDESGYGLRLDRDARRGEPLREDARYEYLPEVGLVAAPPGAAGDQAFAAADFRALASGQLDTESSLRCARRVMRRVIRHHLGGRELKTRRVLAAMR